MTTVLRSKLLGIQIRRCRFRYRCKLRIEDRLFDVKVVGDNNMVGTDVFVVHVFGTVLQGHIARKVRECVNENIRDFSQSSEVASPFERSEDNQSACTLCICLPSWTWKLYTGRRRRHRIVRLDGSWIVSSNRSAA